MSILNYSEMKIPIELELYKDKVIIKYDKGCQKIYHFNISLDFTKSFLIYNGINANEHSIGIDYKVYYTFSTLESIDRKFSKLELKHKMSTIIKEI